MSTNAALQLAGLLGDLMFVCCGAATILYALWAGLKRPSLVRLGRLSLVLAFGACLTTLVLGQGYLGGFSYPMLFVFLLLAMFLTLEFLFQMSVLGVLVAPIGLAITSLRYWQPPEAVLAAPSHPAVAYWWVLRDLAFTTGAAALTLALGAMALLAFFRDHRPSEVVHPNDLRDVALLLARGTLPCFFFAAFAAAAGWWRVGAPELWAAWHLGWLVALLVLGGGVLGVMAFRRPSPGRAALLVALGTLGMLAYALGPFIAGLTSGGRIP